MYKVIENEYRANHQIPVSKIKEKVQHIMKRASPETSTALKLWNNNMSPNDAYKNILPAGGIGHDVRLAAAQLKPLYKAFNPEIITRKYGNDIVDYIERHTPQEVKSIAQSLEKNEDVRKYSRMAQNFVNKVTSRIIK